MFIYVLIQHKKINGIKVLYVINLERKAKATQTLMTANDLSRKNYPVNRIAKTL
jgi:hypothetical protein